MMAEDTIWNSVAVVWRLLRPTVTEIQLACQSRGSRVRVAHSRVGRIRERPGCYTVRIRLQWHFRAQRLSNSSEEGLIHRDAHCPTAPARKSIARESSTLDAYPSLLHIFFSKLTFIRQREKRDTEPRLHRILRPYLLVCAPRS